MRLVYRNHPIMKIRESIQSGIQENVDIDTRHETKDMTHIHLINNYDRRNPMICDVLNEIIHNE